MTKSRGGPSRASTRHESVARDIVKRRDKPYKTEQQRILTRKQKLSMHTSYNKAPAGYTFMPVGTPDLSDRCKELSRQQAYPVYVVNSKPAHKHQADPDKVSHHIYRVGYHFKAEIIEQACEELDYTVHAGKFIKPEELRKRHNQGGIANILTKYGIKMDLLQDRETPEQVRKAIKELFPKIPEEDLTYIVSHAWDETAGRVGTAQELSLPRRVQLATLARIRHHYTDYDKLLRAFDWAQCRSIIEPECLKKLIEWRGENDAEDDQQLEEILRETIVIDDDDDYADDAEIDDDDSSIEIISEMIAGEYHSPGEGGREVILNGRRYSQLAPPDYAVEAPRRSFANSQHLPSPVRQQQWRQHQQMMLLETFQQPQHIVHPQPIVYHRPIVHHRQMPQQSTAYHQQMPQQPPAPAPSWIPGVWPTMVHGAPAPVQQAVVPSIEHEVIDLTYSPPRPASRYPSGAGGGYDRYY